MSQTGLQLAGTQFGRIYGRHTDDSLALSSKPADAAANTAKAAALPASATLVLQSGAWPFAAGTIACRVKPEPGAIVQPTGTVTISGPVEAGLYQWIDTSLGGTVAGLREAHAAWFGAVGNGVADDTAALNSASAALASGGAVVVAANHTHLVSLSGGTLKKRALLPHANVTIRGEDRYTSIIKLADGQADAVPWGMFCWDADAGTVIDGFCLQNLTLDMNAANQGAPSVAPSRPHMAVWGLTSAGGKAVRIEDCEILNHDGVNVVYIVGSLVMRNCHFYANPAAGSAYHDASTIYWAPTAGVNNDALEAVGNLFNTARDDLSVATPGLAGAGACFETHGGHQSIRGNIAVNHSSLGNFCGIAPDDPGSDSIIITGNSVVGARTGLTLYSQPYSGSTGPLSGVVVEGNSFTLETDGWSTLGPGTTIYAQGILVNTTTNPVYGLKIANNVIRYRSFTAVGAAQDSPGCGIYFASTSATPQHRLVSITGNLIDSPHACGILAVGTINGLVIRGNTVRNAGQITSVSNPYRASIYNQADGNAHDISGNTLYDDQATPTTKYFIIDQGTSTTGHVVTKYEMHDNVLWQAADWRVALVTPYYFDPNAGNARAPAVTGRVHTWSGMPPAGNTRYGSCLVDAYNGRTYTEIATVDGTVTSDGGAAVTSFEVLTTSTFQFAGTTTPAAAGLKVGHLARFSNMSTAANNSKDFLITAIAGSVVTVQGTPLTVQAADTAATITFAGRDGTIWQGDEQPQHAVTLMDDFVGDVLADNWNGRVGTDPQCAAPAIIAGQVGGMVRLTTGDDAAASMAVNGCQLDSDLNWSGGSGGLVFEARVKLNAITAAMLFLGLTDQVAAVEAPFELAAGDALTSNASNAVGVLFDTNADTDNWWLVGVKADTDATKQNSAYAPVAATFETWRVEVNTSGTATFYRNGAPIGTAMANAVTATTLLTPVIAATSRGAASRLIDVDYMQVRKFR